MSLFLEQAKRMVKIRSITADGNEELSSYVAGLMQDRGLKTQLQQVTHSIDGFSKRQFNVVGILGDPLVDKKTKKGLLLNTHLDTVGPGRVENWTENGGDPFTAILRDGKIFGLGTADVKLDFLCKLRAVERFRDKKLKQPIYLVGTCGEEVGMFGAKYLIKSGLLNPRYVVVGEPSDLRVVYAHKCLSQFRVSIGYQMVERDARGFNRRIDFHSFGKSAHGSYPHLGVNAIAQLTDFLMTAIDNGFEIRFTKLEGGDTINKVPDRALAEFFLTSHQFEDFKRYFREVIAETGQGGAFKVEFGGLGDSGVKFLPEALYPCIIEVERFFRGLTGELAGTEDGSYNPPFSTINFGIMRQKPGGVDMVFDLRILPQIKAEDIELRIQDGIKKIAQKNPNLNVSVARDRMNPGLNMTLDHDLVKLCREAMQAAGLEPRLDKKATSTEAAQYFGAGYEAVVFGPGISQGNSHSPNEHNLIDHLEKATSFYERLIERVCL